MSLVLLVRHGQASFGTDDYDRLSPAGVAQSRTLGAFLAQQGVDPADLVTGTMRRQRETARSMAEGARWARDVRVDGAWDEFEILDFVRDHAEGPAATDSRAFQAVLEEGMRRWAGGLLVNDSGEEFGDFVSRVDAGLRRLVDEPRRSGPVVVTSSAGVISWIVTHLLGGDVEQWILLNRVCVNAAVTKVVSGRGGLSLVSFNEHGHFTPAQLTYR